MFATKRHLALVGRIAEHRTVAIIHHPCENREHNNQWWNPRLFFLNFLSFTSNVFFQETPMHYGSFSIDLSKKYWLVKSIYGGCVSTSVNVKAPFGVDGSWIPRNWSIWDTNRCFADCCQKKRSNCKKKRWSGWRNWACLLWGFSSEAILKTIHCSCKCSKQPKQNCFDRKFCNKCVQVLPGAEPLMK